MTIPPSSSAANSPTSHCETDPRAIGSWPVYWINLDSRPDRAEFMQSQLAGWPGGSTRIAAVAGATVSSSDVDAYLERMPEFRRRKRTESRIYNPANEIGCLRSHCHALSTAIECGCFPAIVLEDDAVIGPELKALPLPPEWDVLLLGGKPSSAIPQTAVVDGWARFTLAGWRHTVAYAVADASAAQRLISAWEAEALPADVGWAETLRGLRTYAASPIAVPQNTTSPSSIAKGKRPPRAATASGASTAEARRQPDDWVRLKLALPARRALAGAGIDDLAAAARWRRSDLALLHGLGRQALERIEKGLAQRGLTFAPEMGESPNTAGDTTL